MATTQKSAPAPWSEAVASARLILADGTVIVGYGLGATGQAVGELCFNTAMTGYQEVLTDPSYAGQIITFTFPHIGNVGANADDVEISNRAMRTGVRGCVMRASVTEPSNYRAVEHFDTWLKARGIIAIAGVDTRALTARIRDHGMPNAVIAHDPSGAFNTAALLAEAKAWPGLDGMDLVPEVTRQQSLEWVEKRWAWGDGYSSVAAPEFHVVAIDYGLKTNILRCLANAGCRVTVVPATTTAADILARKPDGVFLSNGPGDPAATGTYAVPVIKTLVASGLPVFGICLGHQMLGLAIGAKTHKMHQGHHGANHPVKDHTTDKVEIVSMNHGFAIDAKTLPKGIDETHVSLFDGSNCGIRVAGKPVFSVQHHPEASPGPEDSHYLFTRFTNFMRAAKGKTTVPERV
jgi:carbamoyl-phosphate synthase small subunit